MLGGGNGVAANASGPQPQKSQRGVLSGMIQNNPEMWRPYRDSNPGYHRERVVS